MVTESGLLDRLHQPEYTGENRCLPCTVVNTILTLIFAGVCAVAGTLLVGPGLGFLAGFVILVVGLFAITVRGYLIPGTPELTKRYLPDRVLAAFGKDPVLEHHEPVDAGDGHIDLESALVSVGAIEDCEESEDLCLTPDVREAWERELQALESDPDRETLLSLLGIDVEAVTFQEYGSAFRAHADGRVVGTWESEAAFLADLAAARVFADYYPGWETLEPTVRGQLLNGLRLFVETCPKCGGTPTFGADTVESCCSAYEVAAVSCEHCDVRIFETPVAR